MQFNEEQMRAIVTKAILEGLGQDQRDLLIQKALEALLAPADERGSYYDKRTKLEKMFEEAAVTVLRRVAIEELSKPDNEAKIRGLLGSVTEKLFTEGEARDAVRDALVGAIADGIRKVRD